MSTRKKMKISWEKLNYKPDLEYGVPCARSSHEISILNKKHLLFVYGGEHIARTPIEGTDTCWIANLLTETWKCCVSNDVKPPSRIAHAQAVHQENEVIYIFGGRAGIIMNEKAMNDLWAFDIKTETWTEIICKNETPPPEARSFHRMVCLQNSLYVFGGCGSVSGRLADLHRFDLIKQTWHNLGTSNLRGRGGPNLIPIALGTKLAIVAGFAGEETNDGQVFDIDTETWQDKDSLMKTELEGLRPRSVCVSESFPSLQICVIFGGEVDPSERGHEGAGGFASDLVLLDETSGKVKEMIAAGSIQNQPWPESRGWSSGSGNEVNGKAQLYVFGGLSGDDTKPVRLDDLWRLVIEA